MREHPKTPRLDPSEAVRAALEILDAQGLEHVTLRQIASKLGVQAPALYWHFKDKQDLVEEMAQAILIEGGIGNIEAPKDKRAWAEWLGDSSHLLRKALLSHREGARVAAGASFFHARALARLSMLMTRVLKEGGFDTLHAALAASTVVDYVWGYVIEEQAGPGPEIGTIPKRELDTMFQHIEKIAAPLEFDFEAVIGELDKVAPEKRFDWGLQLIITGLKSSLKEKPRAK